MSKEDKYKIGGYSFTVPSIKDVKYIIGPITYTQHYSPEYDKIFHIFGDYHSLETVCPKGFNEKNTIHINDFLKYKFNDKDEEGNLKNYDIFLELDYLQKEKEQDYSGIKAYLKYINYYGSETDYIPQIYYKFYKCFQIEKQYCKYKNVRFHYTDIRSNKEYVILTEFWHFIIDTFLDNDNYLTDKMRTVNELKRYSLKTIKEILGKPEYFLELYKVNKQIENVYDKDIKKFLLELRQNYIDMSIQMYKDTDRLFQIISSFQKLSRKDLKYIDKYVEDLNDLHVLLLDLYLIGRIFRKFSDDSETAKNIIIYAGDNHSNQYRSFLKNLGFKMINKSISEREGKNFQCINVSKFKNL